MTDALTWTLTPNVFTVRLLPTPAEFTRVSIHSFARVLTEYVVNVSACE